jgi:hypothetical protein
VSPAEALLVFTLEVVKACEQTATPVPAIVVQELPPNVHAQTFPGRIEVSPLALSVPRIWKKRYLRCIARHEVTHRHLDHRPVRPSDLPAMEREVADFMWRRWREKDPLCSVYR